MFLAHGYRGKTICPRDPGSKGFADLPANSHPRNRLPAARDAKTKDVRREGAGIDGHLTNSNTPGQIKLHSCRLSVDLSLSLLPPSPPLFSPSPLLRTNPADGQGNRSIRLARAIFKSLRARPRGWGRGAEVNLQLLVALENLTTFPRVGFARSTRYDVVKTDVEFKKRPEG